MFGVRVWYELFVDCEVLIVGYGESVIVIINCCLMFECQCFFLGYEFGYWIYYKGKMLYCIQSDIESYSDKVCEMEGVVD